MKRNEIKSGVLFALVHFLVEVTSFYVIARFTDSPLVWTLALTYDFFAFMPQGIFGFLRDRLLPKADFAVLGAGITAASLLMLPLKISPLLTVLTVSLGNALVHVHGAEETLRVSPGKMTPAAFFVSGGSFGLITGRLLAKAGCPMPVIFAANLLIIVCSLRAKKLRVPPAAERENLSLYRFHNAALNPKLVVALAVVVVTVRSYMGYGIPTTWNQTTVQSVLLYCFMGLGKALGGVSIDRFGIRKTAQVSTLCALPFLLFGDRVMIVSLLGILLFSMTMAITLGLIVSVLPNDPGFAFGFTTVGLALGTFPVFFYKTDSLLINCVTVSVLTLLSFGLLQMICEKKAADGLREAQTAATASAD